nr:integrase, catalytic region, zinc finger, CCHC-type, peptidase aspartic, catalytic [Tanacetum cinerariifolium]
MTSSNSKNKNVDTTPSFKNDNQSRQFENQRTVNVAAARENVGNTDEEVKEQELEAHYSYMAKIQEVPTADSGIDSEPVEHVQNDAGYNVNVIPDSPDMCEDDIQNEQNDVESDDELVALANLIANLKLDTKQTEFEKYKAFNDRTIDYDKLERKLNEAIGKLAQKDNVIKEGLKTKAYELSVVKQNHDELMKQSLLTKLYYEGLVKQKTKVITDLKLREEHDIEKMLSMKKQLKFLNEVVYKRSQSIQTIHMMELKVSTYNGRPTFANPRYLKQAQSQISCLYVFPYDQSTHANRLILSMEKQLKFLNKVVYKRSLSIQTIHVMAPKVSTYNGRPTFANPRYLKRAQSEISCLYVFPYDQNTYANRLIPDEEETLALERENQFHALTAQDTKILIQTCLMPLAIKTQNGSFKLIHELKQEMHADLKYVKSLENEIYELESDKAEFLDMYDVILQECISKDVMCSYLQSLSDLDTLPELQFLGKPAPFSNSIERIYFPKTKSVPKTNVSEGLSKPVTAQTLPQTAKKAVSNTNVLKPGMYRIDNRIAHTRAPQLPQAVRNTNPRVSTSTGVNHNTNVNRPHHKSNQSRDKVLPNNSQIKAKKTQVEVHPQNPSVSNIMESVTACKGSLNSRTLNANAICATCNKCLVDSNHFTCVTKMLNDVHVRTKKPTVVPISARKPKSQANKLVATPHKEKVASKPTNQKPHSYFRMLYENTRNVTINSLYYVEGLNHSLFSIGQYCDADLEVAFKKSTCFVRDLQ